MWHLDAKRVAVVIPATFSPNRSHFYRGRDLKVGVSEAFTAEQKSHWSHAPGAGLICSTGMRGFSFAGSKLKIRHAPQNPLVPSHPTPLASLETTPGKWL